MKPGLFSKMAGAELHGRTSYMFLQQHGNGKKNPTELNNRDLKRAIFGLKVNVFVDL